MSTFSGMLNRLHRLLNGEMVTLLNTSWHTERFDGSNIQETGEDRSYYCVS